MLKIKSFTLVEMLAVLVIIGVLASVGWPNYVKLQEKNLNREAKSMLLLIRAAEQSYRMERKFYYPNLATESNIANINNALKISLPRGAKVNWTFNLNCTGAPEFAEATRSAGPDSRKWKIEFTGDANPTCSSGSYCAP